MHSLGLVIDIFILLLTIIILGINRHVYKVSKLVKYVITLKVYCDGKRCAGLLNPELCRGCIAKYGLNMFSGWKVESVVPLEKRSIISNVKQAVQATLALLQKYNFKVWRYDAILGGRRYEVEGAIKLPEYPYIYEPLKLYVTLFRNPFWSFPQWLRDNKPDAPQEDYAPAVTINYSLLSHAYYDDVDYLVYVTKDGKILAVSPKLWWRVYVQVKGYVRKMPLKSKKNKFERVAHIPQTALEPLEKILQDIVEELKLRAQEKEKHLEGMLSD